MHCQSTVRQKTTHAPLKMVPIDSYGLILFFVDSDTVYNVRGKLQGPTIKV